MPLNWRAISGRQLTLRLCYEVTSTAPPWLKLSVSHKFCIPRSLGVQQYTIGNTVELYAIDDVSVAIAACKFRLGTLLPPPVLAACARSLATTSLGANGAPLRPTSPRLLLACAARRLRRHSAQAAGVRGRCRTLLGTIQCKLAAGNAARLPSLALTNASIAITEGRAQPVRRCAFKARAFVLDE